MPDRPDRPRIGRKGNKKVRTGCKTCKIRKVKCDETKPQCHRCTTSGRLCDGYAPVPPRARRTVPIRDNDTSYSDASSNDGTVVLARSASSSTPPSPGRLLGENGGALTFFRQHTAPRLTPFVDDYFWNELVLQIGDREPAVRHALAAVNSIYDYCESKGVALTEPEHKRLLHPAYAHGLQQYNRAIGHLVHRSQSPLVGDETVHLVCCVLFVCLELLGGERRAAMTHFEQGIQLLATYGNGPDGKSRQSVKMDEIRQTMGPIFRRLGLQAILFGRKAPLLPLFTQNAKNASAEYAVPFRNMDQATESMVALMDAGLRMAHEVVGLNQSGPGAKYLPERWSEVSEDMKLRRSEILSSLEKWMLCFSPLGALTVASATSDPKARFHCNILRLHHLNSEIWISALLERTESVFDAYTPQFAMIVHLASDILSMGKAYFDNATNPVFVFEMGVVAPLFFTASKCRQRRIRQAALILLENWPRRENIWDPQLLSKHARRLIEIEDPEALDPDGPDDVLPPEWKRIHKIDFEDIEDEEGNLVNVALFYRKPCGLDEEWEIIKEVLPLSEKVS